MQSTNNPDPHKSLFDFINYHKSTTNEDEDFKSVSALTQSDTNDNSDSPKSLFDFINSHKSAVNDDEDVQSLSDLASKYLSIKRENREVPTYFSFPVGSENCQSLSSVVRDSDFEKTKQEISNKFTSLEDYTQSYLTSKNSAVHCQITAPSCNSKFSTNSCDFDIANKRINESLSNIKICDVKEQSRTIDLTTALLNVTKNNSESAVAHTEDKVHWKPLFYPAQECIIDISSLATENVLYSDAKLSYFGYVISRKWIPMSKKYKYIGKSHPYNIASSFKFSVPSPDELYNEKQNKKQF